MKILIFIFLIFLLPLTALAAVDLSMDSTSISFSKDSALEGETIRVFIRVFNVGDEDVYGFVRFLGNGKEINDPQPVSVKINTYDDVFIDWQTSAGTYEIKAEIISTNPADSNGGNNSVVHSSYFVDKDTDSDGIGDVEDEDDDNDGISDENDAFPFDVNEDTDTDNDGIGNNADEDDDNDGLSDEQENTLGTDPLKSDTDGDGVSDKDDIFPLDSNETKDNDNDNIGDNEDEDDDNDGLSDKEEKELGTDPLKSDTDEDGVSDKHEVDNGTNPFKSDTDEDGVPDGEDAFPLDSNEFEDADNDGIGSNSDTNDNDKAPSSVLGWKIKNDKVILDAQESEDEDGEIIEYKWDLGDGQVVYGKELEYEYEQPGDYEVVLAVKDDAGQVSKSETVIKISRFDTNSLIIIGIVVLSIILILCITLLIRQKLVIRK